MANKAKFLLYSCPKRHVFYAFGCPPIYIDFTAAIGAGGIFCLPAAFKEKHDFRLILVYDEIFAIILLTFDREFAII